jgi:putative ABC transport system permease protein
VIGAYGARMKPTGIIYLYGIRLRARFVQEGLVIVGIAVGVALLFASRVESTSLGGSVGQLTGGLVGRSQLQLAARGPHGFDARLFGEVQRLPGVRSAAPVLETSASVLGPAGQRAVDLIGADPRFVRLGGALVRHFSAAQLAREKALALPAPLARQINVEPLQPVGLQIGASTTQALLGITLQGRQIGALVHSPVAMAPLAYAQQLAGMPGRLTRIFVRARGEDTAEVRAGLARLAKGRLNVEPADFDATVFQNAAGPTNQSTGLFAAISALVGFLFAYNAVLLGVPSRRGLITDLRLDGYSPSTVVEVLMFDALVLGVTASLLGLVLGNELSLRLFKSDPGYLSFAFPIGSQRIVTWQSIALAIAGGLLAACFAVLYPLRDVLFHRADTARRKYRFAGWVRRAIGRQIGVGGLAPAGGVVCLIVTTGILVFAPQGAIVGVVALTAALLLLLPSIIRGVLTVMERLILDVRARAPFVALSELRAPSGWARTVAIAATGTIALFGIVSIQGAHADLQRGLDRSAQDISAGAEVWAFGSGLSNLLATTPFHPNDVDRLERLPGVRAVSLYRGGFLDWGDRRVWVSAPPVAQSQLVPAHQLVEGDLGRANALVRKGGWAVISKVIATERHLRIGQSFTLPSPRPMVFRVAALSTNIGWPPGAVVINATDYANGWESSDASAYEITTVPHVSGEAVRREVREALGPTSLTVQTARQREEHQRATSRQGLSRLSQISTLVLIAAILAMAAAIGNMIWQRRQRLLGLKLDGFDDLAVWRTLLLESALLVGSGCAIGAIFGLYGQLLGSHAVLKVTGFPVVFVFDAVGAISSFALMTTGAVAIIAIPGYLLARARGTASFSD